jgi:hypothetical protein
MGGNLEHPGGGLALAAESRETLVHPQEHLLGQILGFRPGHEPVQEGHHPWAKGRVMGVEILDWGGR